MARKNQGRTRGSSKGQASRSFSQRASLSGMRDSIRDYDYRNLLDRVTGNPLLLNTGIGIGSFFLVRSAIRYYKSHPQIGEFISENMDMIESKFKEYQSTQGTSREDNQSEARH